MHNHSILGPFVEIFAERVEEVDHTAFFEGSGHFQNGHQGADWNFLCEKEVP